MKQGSGNRRSRSRGGGRRPGGGGGGGGKNSTFESNGPDVKIRGTAQQVQEKYLALARDASSSGDRISAEAFFQFAEHYFRIVNGDGDNGAGKGRGARDDRKPQGQPQPQPEQPPAPNDEQPSIVDSTAASLAAVTEPEKADQDTPRVPDPASET